MKNLFDGLRQLSHDSFPKKCSTCGKVYNTVEEYLKDTEELSPGKTGFKQSYDDDDSTIVEVYRNCSCGSTLLDFFQDRRDTSPRGLARRKKFGELLDYLVSEGMEVDVARAELLKIVHGKKSEILQNFKPPKKLAG